MKSPSESPAAIYVSVSGVHRPIGVRSVLNQNRLVRARLLELVQSQSSCCRFQYGYLTPGVALRTCASIHG